MTEHGRPTATERMWGAVRLTLGLAQVMAATATLYFLIQTGPSVLTIGGLTITCLFIVLSKVLFRER